MMMFFRFLLMISVLAGSGFAVRWLLRKVNSKSWASPHINRLAGYWPYSLAFTVVVWGVGSLLDISFLKIAGATATTFILITSIILLVTLPLSLAATKMLRKQRTKKVTPPDASKRLLLKGAAAAAPLLILGNAAKGVANSFSDVRFPAVDMNIPNLPERLEGTKILHMSDLHLGYYFGLQHLENTLLDAEKFDPDLLVVTGDIADDLSLMTDAMKLIGQYKPGIARFASVGNHEYFRGIKNAVRQIERGPVPLLKDSHLQIAIADTPVTIGGADDPGRLRGNLNGFLEKSVQTVFRDAPDDGFRLLLSHRPQGLDVAGKHKVDLVLSGHTHAGQLGLNGKSAFSYLDPGAYLWGIYKKDSTRLYTSAGMGHWFPFRLGVPLEAPLITLKRT